MQTKSFSVNGDVTRRDFIKTTAVGVAVASSTLVPMVGGVQTHGDTRRRRAPRVTPELLIAELYKSLSPQQRDAVVLAFDDPRRLAVASDWHICADRIDQIFNPSQQTMIHALFVSLHTPRYAGAVMAQVEHDNERGLGSCAAAMFEHPQIPDCFEFVLTGRHVTRRCCAADGLSTIGGPVHFGGDHWVFRRLAHHANAFFETLAGEFNTGMADGVTSLDLWDSQERAVLQFLPYMLAPLRRSDVSKAIRHAGAARPRRMQLTCFRNMEQPANDAWQIQGPTLAWYFRKHPHFYTWIEFRDTV